MADGNATWQWSMSLGCATSVESTIVPWYWFGAGINTGAADEDDRDLTKA
jgi:hypothetical protein